VDLQKKVCLLGAYGVGKTSLVRRFVYELFEEKYLTTIGVNVSRKTVEMPTAKITYLLWDLNGGAKFDSMMISYMSGAAGAIVVCDLSRRETFEQISYYADHLIKLRPQAKLILVGNKADLLNKAVLEKDLKTLADQYQVPYFLTSAKTGDQVEAMFIKLGEALLTK
jgi:small GTP-binding protein